MFDFMPLPVLPALLILALPAVWGLRIWAACLVHALLWLIALSDRDFGGALDGSASGGWTGVFVFAWASGLLLAVGARALGERLIRGGLFSFPPSGRVRDRGLAVIWLIALLPVGRFALTVFSGVFAGTSRPLAVHLALFSALALIAVLAVLRLRGGWRGAAVGAVLSCAWALWGSMQLEATLLANMNSRYDRPGVEKCLGLGPEGRAITTERPLMTLTVPRPIMLRVEDPESFGPLYWAFGEDTFVGTMPPLPTPECTPSTAPLLP